MHKFDLKFVYKSLLSTEKEGVINLWTTCGIIPHAEALRRVEEVSTIILVDNKIIGVSTVYPGNIKTLDNTYFLFRMFIEKEYRGSNQIRKKVMQMNFSKLSQKYAKDFQGIAMELENNKLASLGENTNYMTKRGYTYAGLSQRNLQLWYVNFNEPLGIFI